ncbi:galactokinase [Corynebacterium kalinowskii]|uniref:Galactokinase n=1 Tax=Corynebacterium kalinowskii TaxID=2675216 RepID=A0A6B8VJL1_9CORY|nr:galactokinase family protein [Corynebacterium kalinowskii]QGU01654.1 galactokinase [Corynebacterium kalinowskii]
MPVWLHPDAQLIDRVAELHQQSYDSTVPRTAVSPATWNFLGEHTDHVGGLVINATAPLHVAVAASPREDDTIMVTTHELDVDGDVQSFTDSVTLYEVSQCAAQLQHGGSDASPSLTLGGPGVRLAGVVWSMVNRQYLSRDTKGFNITVVSEIPARVGLGDEVAAEVAFASILAESSEHKLDAPLKARLAEICASSAQLFSAVPSFRARYTAALRGSEDAFNIVDYADGSVTHAPMLRDATDYASFLVALPHDEPVTDIAERKRFVDEAAAAFGVDYLRRLPDATQRVTQWLTAMHKANEADDYPGLEEAHRWLSFFERETERATKASMVLRARKAKEALSLVGDSQRDLESLYQVVPEKETALANLCLARGALAVRSAAARLAGAVIVHAEAKKSTNLISDLAADGFTVVPLRGC